MQADRLLSRSLPLFAAALFLVLAFSPAADGAPRTTAKPKWTFTDLGVDGSHISVALAINVRGDVGGISNVTTPGGSVESHGFLWQNGAARDLGSELGPSSQSEVGAISDRGLVVLQTDTGVKTWKNGTWTHLGFHATVDGINRLEHFIGTVGSGTTTQRGYVYRNGTMLELGTLGGTRSNAAAINDKGVIVGSSTLAGDTVEHAYIYRNGRMTSLGTLGGNASIAMDINNQGTVVGNARDAAGNWKVFTHDGKRMRAVPNLPAGAVAHAINDRGVIIGIAQAGGFVHDRGKTTLLIDIPGVREQGFTRIVPLAINGHGWIVGSAEHTETFRSRAFLLVPK